MEATMKIAESSVVVLAMTLLGAAPILAQTPAPATQPGKTVLPATTIATPRSQLQAEFAVAAGDTVLFAYQARELTQRTSKILASQAAWLKQHANLPISLEAYCDDDLPPEQTRQLCLDRGNVVKAELVRLGVGAERIKVVAFIDPPIRKGGGASAGGRKDEDKNRRGNRRVMTRIDS
jgi:outer membrane protein OmpA-like peptidoglycan-associated protein